MIRVVPHLVAFVYVATSATAGLSAAASPATSAPSPASSTDVSFERPKWVDAPPELRDGAYYTKTFVGPEATRSECEQKIAAAVVEAARDYARKTLGPEPTEYLAFDYETLRPRVVDGPPWQETVRTRELELVYLHVPLKFDDKLRRAWESEALGGLRRARLVGVAVGYGVAIAALSLLAFVARSRDAGAPAGRAALRGWGGAALLVAVVIVVLYVLGVG